MLSRKFLATALFPPDRNSNITIANPENVDLVPQEIGFDPDKKYRDIPGHTIYRDWLFVPET